MPALTSPNNTSLSDLARDAATKDSAEVLRLLGTSPAGLTEEEAAARLEQYGPNEVGREKHEGWLQRLYIAARNPLVILLTILAILSFATGDFRAGVVMLLMVVLGVSLRFVQETQGEHGRRQAQSDDQRHRHRGARRPAQGNPAPTARPRRHREALRRRHDPRRRAAPFRERPVRHPGDADRRIHAGREDRRRDVRGNVSPIERSNTCFLGTSVESGSATAVIVATGAQTYFGKVARSLAGQQVETAFDRGVKRFTWLMIRFMVVMVPLVFVINGLTKHDWKEAFFFSLAVAVGLTPEMLPMIVSVCLSKGALAMSRKKVIVKRLNSIQNFGAMNVLCTDKTGTLTMDHVILEIYCDVFKSESETVLQDAYLLSHFQTGLKNILDRAVLHHQELHGALSHR